MPPPHVTTAELKGEHLTPVSARDLKRLIALTLALVACGNLLAGWVLARWSPNIGYTVVREKWTMLQRLDQPADWLVLGDSSANQGVDPLVLEAHLGGRVVNLATVADMLALNDAWMLQYYIARFGPPRGVVLVHAYDMWERDARDQLLAEVPLPWGYWNNLQPTLTVDTWRALKLAELRYLPLYSRHDSLLMLIRGWWRPGDGPRFTPAGYMPVGEADPQQVDADMREHLAATDGRLFVMSADNRRALGHIGRLASAHNFDVFLAHAPLHDRLYAHDSFRAYLAQVTFSLEQWADDDPHRHFLFPAPILFSRDRMQNVDHLTVTGAARYTEVLAVAIGSRSPVPERDDTDEGTAVSRLRTN
jgi:hypothetical protein